MLTVLDAYAHRDPDQSQAGVPVTERDEGRGTRSTAIHIAVLTYEVCPIAEHSSAPPTGALHIELEDLLGDVTHPRILEQAFGS